MPYHTVHILERAVRVELTARARQALEARPLPLLAEMELYFSCLIRKRVRFHNGGEDGTPLSDIPLRVSFRPVMTSHCRMDDDANDPPLTDFPIANCAPYVPHWLRIDFRHEQWLGDFGYADG